MAWCAKLLAEGVTVYAVTHPGSVRAALLPQDMRAQLMELPEPLRTGAEELRLRSGRRLSLLLAEGESPVGARPVQPRDLDTCLLYTSPSPRDS